MRFSLLTLLLLFLLVSCSESPSEPKLKAVYKAQALRYPKMEVQDWYKLMHQTAMGNRHLGVDDSLIYNYLLSELDRINASSEEPLIEYISDDSVTIRLNLRPFKAMEGDPQALFAAMQKTWNTVEPSVKSMEREYGYLQHMARRGLINLSPDEVVGFFSEKSGEGYPAVHHSTAYEAAYKPAYRVLLRAFVPE